LTGATLRNDVDENKELYGEALHNKQILLTDRRAPASANALVTALNRYSAREEKGKPIESRAKDAINGDADRSKPRNK